MATTKHQGASRAEAAPEATETYVVVSPILYSAATKRAEVGEEIELTDAQAAGYGYAVKPKAS